MAVLINFKICDNAKECEGVAICPTGALSWDEERKTIIIDNDKCICCGSCERACPIGCISVVETDEEYKEKQKEIDDDPRTVKDLFVDRYGAAALSEFFMINEDELDSKLTDGILLVECYDEEATECLLKSIPIKEITSNMPSDTMFYKVPIGDAIKEKYHIEVTPTLLIFKNKKYLGKVEGYYEIDEKDVLLDKIAEIIK